MQIKKNTETIRQVNQLLFMKQINNLFTLNTHRILVGKTLHNSNTITEFNLF